MVELITCPVCDGKKTVNKDLSDMQVMLQSFPRIPCERCNGLGEIVKPEEPIWCGE